MRVAIIGSRNISLNNERDILQYLPQNIDIIISGGAVGADKIAENTAKALHLPIMVYKPDYARFQCRAPLVRNAEIIDKSDCVIALWDSLSRGTAGVIQHCVNSYTPITVLLCKNGEILYNISQDTIKNFSL